MGIFFICISTLEIGSLLSVSESTVKRRLRELECSSRQGYSNISDDELDIIVEKSMREFPNCGYRRMTGMLLGMGHRLQQNRIRECMRRVNPEGVLLNVIVDYKRNLPWEDSRQIIVGRFRGNFRLGKGAQDDYD